MDRKRIWGSVKILLIGAIVVFLFFLWYKQFSYRAISYYDLKSEYAAEKSNFSAEFDGETYVYAATRSFVQQWYQTPYYILTITNSTDGPIVYQVYDADETAAAEEGRLDPGEEISRSYQITETVDLFAAEGEADGVSTMVTNREYMNVYKSTVKWTLFAGVLLVLLSAAAFLFGWKGKLSGKIAPAGMLGLSAFAVITCYADLYSYFFSCCFFGVILLGILWMLGAEPQKERAGFSDRASGEGRMERYLSIGFVSLLMVLFLFSQMLNSANGFLQKFSAANHMGDVDYILILVLFLVLFLGGIMLTQKRDMAVTLFAGREAFALFLLTELVMLLSLLDTDYPLGLLSGGVFLVSLAGLLVYYGKHKRQRAESLTGKALCLLTEIVAGIGVVLNNFQINYWGNGDSDVHHIHWYYIELYRIGFRLPFIGGGEEGYGHYGLFYKLPMELFGHNLLVIGTTTAFFAAVMVAALLGTVHKVTRSYVSRMLAAVALLVILTKDFAYPMNVPQRLLFPALLLFFLVSSREKRFTPAKIGFGYLLCFLSILWSTDSGLMCSAVYTLYLSLRLAQEKKQGIFACIGYFFALLPVVAILFFGSYGTVQAYNLSMGAAWTDYSLKGFLGNLTSEEYMTTAQMNTFYFGNAQWLCYLIFFIITASLGIVRCGLFRQEDRSSSGILWLMFSAMGLCFMVIILSRPEDYTLVLPFVLLQVLMILERQQEASFSYFHDMEKLGQKHIASCMAFVAGILLVSAILSQLPWTCRQVYVNVTENRRFDYAAVEEGAQELAKLPVDQIYFCGNGLRLLFMDQDIRISEGKKAEITKTDKPYVLTNLELSEEQFTAVEEYTIDRYSYTLYQKLY